MNKQKNSRILQISLDTDEIKPWNSTRVPRISTLIKKNVNHSDIFTISNRTSQQHPFSEKKSPIEKVNIKPKTAPQNKKTNRRSMYDKFTNLGVVAAEQIAKDEFQQNLQNIHFYQNFRTSLQQKKQLMYLKPQMQTVSKYYNRSHKKAENTTEGLQKLKTQIYKSLRQQQNKSQVQETKELAKKKNNVKQRSSFVEYMTEYKGDNNSTNLITQRSQSIQAKKSQRSRNVPVSVMRQKLKNYYKMSKYYNNVERIRHGQGIPISIIQ